MSDLQRLARIHGASAQQNGDISTSNDWEATLGQLINSGLCKDDGDPGTHQNAPFFIVPYSYD